MSRQPYARLCVALSIAVVLVSIAAACVFVSYFMLSAHVAFAVDQVQIFDEMRSKALSAESAAKAASYLNYAVKYYPSGTKQHVGTPLDTVVESHRSSAIRDIVAHLRKTGIQDYGEDPQAWIDKLCPNQQR